MAELECINPFSGEATGKFTLESFEDQKSKVSKLKSAQKIWKQVSLEERILLVQKATKYFEENRDEIAKDITEGRVVDIDRDTDVAPLKTLVEIIMVCPGKYARDFRIHCCGS